MSDAWHWAGQALGDAGHWIGKNVLGQADIQPTQQWGTDPTALAQQQRQEQMGATAAQQGGQLLGAQWGQGQEANQELQAQAQQFYGLGQQLGNQAAGYGQQQQYGYGAEQQAMQRAQDAASGKTPSAAEMQMRSGLDSAIQSQMSMANSTRGGFGAAEAGREGAQTGAGMQQAAVNQGAALRAQEMATARQQEAALAGQIAGQGQQGQLGSEQGQLGAMNTGLGASEAGYGTQLGYEQAGAGNYFQGQNVQQGYEGQGLGALNAQEQASLTGQGIQQNAANQNASNSSNFFGKALGAVGGVAAMADLHMIDPGTTDTHLTLREEPGGEGEPGFIAVHDAHTGEVRELDMKPLAPHHKAIMESHPHGAGPLLGKNAWQDGDTVAHDAAIGGDSMPATSKNPLSSFSQDTPAPHPQYAGPDPSSMNALTPNIVAHDLTMGARPEAHYATVRTPGAHAAPAPMNVGGRELAQAPAAGARPTSGAQMVAHDLNVGAPRVGRPMSGQLQGDPDLEQRLAMAAARMRVGVR